MQNKAASTERTIWTVGHSNHPLEEFLDLLGRHHIGVVVDVRSAPYSRYASHFNKEVIRNELGSRQIKYLFLGDKLGGRAEDDRFYDEAGHVRYDRLAESAEFQQGIRRLLDGIAEGLRLALMCGEEDPSACHRRLLIGRVLGQRGVKLLHIRGDARVQSEEQLAAEEHFRKTKGQLTLFEMEEADEWKSTQSVLPRKPPESSSKSSPDAASGG